jgi:4-amino-4-deoxy-L-arabinose transferase-like glycosyltransferase
LKSAAAPPPSARALAREVLWLLLPLGLLYFLPLGLRPLTNPDEGRYVEIAREMAVSGDWVSPRLNGVLYFEKPPLMYWLEAGAISLGGMNLWVLRFWPAFLALLGCAAVYLLARELWGPLAGRWSAYVLGACAIYFGIGQIIILDMAVTVFLTWALAAFLLAVRTPPGRKRRRLCWVFYGSMALALMTKGLIGVLIPCAIIFLWMLLLNRWRELRHAHLATGLFLLLALALPWHLAAARANPPPGGWDWAHFFSRDPHDQGFLWYYFVHEHVLRYLDPGVEHRDHPWWFFTVILAGGLLPWTFFLPSALRAAARGGWTRLKREPEIVLLFLWALFPLLFFSASSSKLIPYILPSVPPLALLIGRFLALAQDEPRAAPLLAPLRALGATSLLAAAGLIGWVLLAKSLPLEAAWIEALAFFFALAGVSILRPILGPQADAHRSLAQLGSLSLIFLFCASLIAAHLVDLRRPSTAPAADWLRPQLLDTDQVFVLWDYGPYQDFPPLLGRTIGVAGQLPDEQTFGATLETAELADRYPGLADYLSLLGQPGTTAAQLDDAQMRPFLARLAGPARVFVLVAADQFPKFRQLYPDAPIRQLWTNGQFLIFGNAAAAR